MLKIREKVKGLGGEAAAAAVCNLLGNIPSARVIEVERGSTAGGGEVDLVVRFDAFDRSRTLVCEVKNSGQPRIVREALLRLRDSVATFGTAAVPMLIAPYLSPLAQALCRYNGVAYLDEVGNARLALDDIFIERRSDSRPAADRRALRSLFRPRSAQVLRVLLRDPRRAWRVIDLARAADVSLGHVSNVRKGLLDREWAQLSASGLHLSAPDRLLDAWRDDYREPAGEHHAFYTVLHGAAFERAAREVLGAPSGEGKALFSSFSAAQWLAPFVRTGMQYFHADRAGLERLKAQLKLAPSTRGENVVVTVPKDAGSLADAVYPAPGVACTDAVQTYLDLWIAGERGQEAAEHLRRELLSWR